MAFIEAASLPDTTDQPPHTTDAASVDAMASKSHTVMKISQNGQISIPAHIRARWKTDRVHVVDMWVLDRSDQVLVFPAYDDDIERTVGIDKGLWPPTDELRRRMREEEMEIEDRKRREGVLP